MSRLVWTETLDGWFGGPYQIELAAPRLWVLSRRPKGVAGPAISQVVGTGGSLTALKQVADELERRRLARRRLSFHLAVTFAFVACTVVGLLIEARGVAIFGLAAGFVAALRTFVIWVSEVTGSAWAVVSQSYQ